MRPSKSKTTARKLERVLMGDDLFEYSTEETLRREAAAERLREIADQLSRKNEIEIEREGMRYTVKVPNEVTFSYEVELGDDSSEIEIEIKW